MAVRPSLYPAIRYLRPAPEGERRLRRAMVGGMLGSIVEIETP
jgi:hypothetical protein